ncbi:MAG TPA: hypothetical protein VKA78_05125, partial [Pyrinomonadaceae bacterium]|nr:hypothetical protein [Pyrinomonadaceae bacterium]
LGLSTERASTERAALDQRQEELNRDEELLRRREEDLRALEARAATDATARASFATFVLSNTIRSGPDGRELIIRPGNKYVRLIAYLDDDKAERYSASLQRVSGEEVWKTILQKPRSELKRLTLVVPAAMFNDRHYFVKIEGLTRDERPSKVAEYALAVRNERSRD